MRQLVYQKHLQSYPQNGIGVSRAALWTPWEEERSRSAAVVARVERTSVRLRRLEAP